MIILTRKYENESTRIVLKDDCCTWKEIADRFIFFLQGCGYIVDGIDVAEYLVEQYGFQRNEEPESTQEISLPTKKGKRRAKKR